MIAPQHAKLVAYERELIGLVTVVKHWRPYLWGRTFLIRFDHYSLMYILDQRLSIIPQHQWVSKLLGYDFTVEYKPGKQNMVADALSRRDATEPSLMALSESPSQYSIISRLKSLLMKKQASSHNLLRLGNSHLRGRSRTVSSSTNDGYISHHPHLSYKKFSTPSIILHMRDLRKHYIGSSKLFILLEPNKQFNSLLVTAPSANAIK